MHQHLLICMYDDDARVKLHIARAEMLYLLLLKLPCLLRRQGTNRSSGSRGSSEDDPPFVAGPSDAAGVAKRQRRMAEKNRRAPTPHNMQPPSQHHSDTLHILHQRHLKKQLLSTSYTSTPFLPCLLGAVAQSHALALADLMSHYSSLVDRLT